MNEIIFWLYWSKYFSQFDPWVLSPFELLTRDWTIFERPTRAFWLATDNSNSEYYFLYFYCRKKKNYFEKKRIFFFFLPLGMRSYLIGSIKHGNITLKKKMVVIAIYGLDMSIRFLLESDSLMMLVRYCNKLINFLFNEKKKLGRLIYFFIKWFFFFLLGHFFKWIQECVQNLFSKFCKDNIIFLLWFFALEDCEGEICLDVFLQDGSEFCFKVIFWPYFRVFNQNECSQIVATKVFKSANCYFSRYKLYFG